MNRVDISPDRMGAFFTDDRLELATRIRDITHENPTPKDLDQLKRQIYELTRELDRDMNQRAFLVSCLYILKNPNFESKKEE